MDLDLIGRRFNSQLSRDPDFAYVISCKTPKSVLLGRSGAGMISQGSFSGHPPTINVLPCPCSVS